MGQLTPLNSKLKPVNWLIYSKRIDSKRIIQAHVLQALKTLLVLNYRQAVYLGYGGCSFVPIDI